MSFDETVRGWLDENLKPLLPATWKLIPYQRMPQTISAPTVLFKQLSFTNLPEAPAAALEVAIVITVADPHLDQDRAEDALDDEVLELVFALDSLPNLSWSTAQKVLVNETYLGWDITCSTISAKKEV